MQQTLSVFKNYCKEWKLTVNTEKTKIVIFGQGRRANTYQFKINMKEIEITKEYRFLGILLRSLVHFNFEKTHCKTRKQSYVFTFKENKIIKSTIQCTN